MSTHREAADGRSRPCDYLMVFVKAPSPGEVKTRLAPALSADEAADVYRCLVRDTLAVVRRLRGVQVVVAYSGNTAFPTLAWLRDGRPLASGRLLWGFKPQVIPQQGRTLGDRLIHAFGWAFSKGARRVVAVGSDAPELSASWVRQAFRELHHRPVVLGPTSDGGYQLIGLDAPYPALFVDMPWSSAQLFDRFLDHVEIFLPVNVDPVAAEILLPPDRLIWPQPVELGIAHRSAMTFDAMLAVKFTALRRALLVDRPVWVATEMLLRPLRRSQTLEPRRTLQRMLASDHFLHPVDIAKLHG